jgi:hypothetical protein
VFCAPTVDSIDSIVYFLLIVPTQDEDKQNRKKTYTENQKDEDNGQLSAHERLSVPASY